MFSGSTDDKEVKQAKMFDQLGESLEFAGICVAHLARDPKVLAKTLEKNTVLEERLYLLSTLPAHTNKIMILCQNRPCRYASNGQEGNCKTIS